MKRHCWCARFLAVVVLLFASAARGDIVVVTDRAAFLALVGRPGTDNFNDLSPGAEYDLALSRQAGDYRYTVAASGWNVYGAGTSDDVWISTAIIDETLTFSHFSPGITAFGGYFFGSDYWGQYVPNTTIWLTADDGTTLQYTLPNTSPSSFLGFVSSSALSSVSIASNGGYWVTANDVVMGVAPVPEPGTVAMWSAGLALIFVFARTRRWRPL